MSEQQEREAYTYGHCKSYNQPGGCQQHNLHCGYPDCDRKAAPPSQPPACAAAEELNPAIVALTMAMHVSRECGESYEAGVYKRAIEIAHQQATARDQTIRRLEAETLRLRGWIQKALDNTAEWQECVAASKQPCAGAALTDTTPTDKGEK